MSVSIESALLNKDLFEYKIVLLAHQDIAEKIAAIQQKLNADYVIENAVKSKAQLLLVRFRQSRLIEERIINRLRIVAMGAHPIKIEIKNFGSFPAHSIFLNVTSKVPVTELVKKIKHDTQRLMKSDADNKPHFMNDAQLFIATKLKPWQYEKAWLEYSNTHFTGRFIAERMILFRRKNAESRYLPIESFEFQNLPINTKQGELF